MAMLVVLGEDNYLVREGVRRLMEPEPDIEVVAACEEFPSLVAAIAEHEPDVVLTDIRTAPDPSWTRAFRSPTGCVRSTRAWASSCSVSSRPRVRSRPARARRRPARLPAQGSGER